MNFYKTIAIGALACAAGFSGWGGYYAYQTSRIVDQNLQRVEQNLQNVYRNSRIVEQNSRIVEQNLQNGELGQFLERMRITLPIWDLETYMATHPKASDEELREQLNKYEREWENRLR